MGDNYKVILNKINYRSGTSSFASDEVNTNGISLSINKANIFIYPNNEATLSYSKGQEKVKIASFMIEVSSGSDAVIESLTLTC